MMGHKYQKPSYEGANHERYIDGIESKASSYDNLLKLYNKLKRNQVAPYCNSCLSQDVHATTRTVTCHDCGQKFPFKEIKK